jgi:hypothetical protein
MFGLGVPELIIIFVVVASVVKVIMKARHHRRP